MKILNKKIIISFKPNKLYKHTYKLIRTVTYKKYLFIFKVFLQAKVFFSIGGQHFSSEPVHFSYMPDTVLEHARDVTIKLHHRIGKYLQVNLQFALRWLMLSEVSFISGTILLKLFYSDF